MRAMSAEQGFTLIEVLVAFVIATFGVAVVFQMIGRGANSLALSQDYYQAMLVAETALHEPDPNQGSDGQAGRFHWRKSRAPTSSVVETDRRQEPFNRDLVLEDLTVTVSWNRNGRAHEFSLRTQRLASTKEALAP